MLPRDILSQSILSNFCDGKSISTFLVVAQSNANLNQDDEFLPSLIRNTLVHRFRRLREHSCLKNNSEVTDVLDVIREEIRNTSYFENGYGGSSLSLQHYSHWCAIVDYFEKQMPGPSCETRTNLTQEERHNHTREDGDDGNAESGAYTTRRSLEFTIWCGPLQTSAGIVRCAKLSSPHWTATAMEFWHRDFELFEYSLGIPPRSPPLLHLYGAVTAIAPQNYCYVMAGLCNLLNDEYDDLGRYTVIPRQENGGGDDRPDHWIVFTKQDGSLPALKCYWDHEEDDTIDWERGIERLGENAIRIMKRMGPSFGCTET